MHPIELTNDNFEKEVLQSTQKVLVDFWAPRCGPCRMITPVMEQLAEELDDVSVCKVDVDEYPEIAIKYNIRNIPTIMAFEGGEVIETVIGIKSKTEIMAMVGK